MGSMFLLALLSCVPKAPPEPPPAAPAQDARDDGRIGMRFHAVPEGLLVEAVQDGLGAADAGLTPGDLVVAVGTLEAAGRPPGEVRDAIIGPPDTTVPMTVRAPLTGEERTVDVERRLPGSSAPVQRASNRNTPPPSVRTFNSTLRRSTPEEVTAAAGDLIADGFGGLSIGEAVRGGLRLAAKENPDNARAALAALDAAGDSDWMYQRARAEALRIMGEHAAAADGFVRAEALRPPDHAAAAGARSDLGGDPKARRLFVESAWDAGRQPEAIEAARALLRTGYDNARVRQKLGMADIDRGTPWSAPLPPLDDFEVSLLDGSPWALSDSEGQVVVMAFWATWCGPCRKEMPELEALWQARGPEGATFLAVSIDDPGAEEKIAQKVEEFGITFPVAHRPDLGDDFNVSGIPAIRVLNRRGALHYAAKGYSPSSVERLDEQIVSALEDAGEETGLGDAWSADGSASLAHFLPLTGAQDVWSDGAHTIVGLEGAAPMIFEGPLPERAETTVDSRDPETAGRLAWLGGPVAAEPKGRLVRAWDPDGTARWVQTTAAPIVDLAAGGGLVWVATRAAVHGFRSDGSLAVSHDLAAADLSDADGGVWAVADGQRHWLTEAAAEPRGAAPDGQQVDAAGGVATGIAQDLVVGRFGPDGALRPVAVRTDNSIIGTGGDGAPAFTWDLSQPARIAAGDVDGDGRDELLVSIARQGVAVVELNLP